MRADPLLQVVTVHMHGATKGMSKKIRILKGKEFPKLN